MILEHLNETSPLAAVGVLLTVFVGACIQATIGVGFGLAVAPVLFFIRPDLVPALVIILGMSSAFGGIVGDQKHIVWNEVFTALVGRVIGIGAAGYILSLVTDIRQFSIVFALAMLVTLGLSMLRVTLPFNRVSLSIAGIFSGFLGTLSAVGSIPMALVYQDQRAIHARTTMNAFFAIGVVPSLIALWYAGFVGVTHFMHAAILSPVIVLASVVSKYLVAYSDKRFRKFLLGFSGVASLAILLKALIDSAFG